MPNPSIPHEQLNLDALMQTFGVEMDAEALAQQAGFVARADEFVARLQAAEITGETEVRLVFSCVDQRGAACDPVAVPIVVRVETWDRGTYNDVAERTQTARKSALIDTVNRAVRFGRLGWGLLPVLPGQVVRIQDFALEIERRADSHEEKGPTELLASNPLPVDIEAIARSYGVTVTPLYGVDRRLVSQRFSFVVPVEGTLPAASPLESGCGRQHRVANDLGRSGHLTDSIQDSEASPPIPPA